jgi:hypothetical protein
VENTFQSHRFKGIREPIELTITLCLARQRFGQLTLWIEARLLAWHS